jgi:hypothetical protein
MIIVVFEEELPGALESRVTITSPPCLCLLPTPLSHQDVPSKTLRSLIHLDENTLSTREVHVQLVVVSTVDCSGRATRVPGLEGSAASVGGTDVAIMNSREGRRDTLVTAGHTGAVQNHVDLSAFSGHWIAEEDPVDGPSERRTGHHEDICGKEEGTLGGTNADGGNGAAGIDVSAVDDGQLLPGV